MDTLLTDIFRAYYDARRNKRNTPSQLRFEMDLETNLISLYHELRDRRYRPSPSVCFVVCDSVKREVFASDFRDRVVHHLYYNYVAELFDHQFIYDSYSCRNGKGTLLGINRLQHHIRSVSRNYTRKAYVLKMDIRGYFMSINRTLLREMVHEMIDRVHLPDQVKDIVCYLTDIVALKDPMQGAVYRGSPSEWDDLPPSKCLSHSPQGVGLPIGDLTSQLFSNVFLNRLDWFVSMHLGFKHYGRYVDDFYIVDTDRERLLAAEQAMAEMLASIGLALHRGKTRILPATQPVRFLGAVVYPYYRHCSSRTMRKYTRFKRCYLQICQQVKSGRALSEESLDVARCVASMQSYRGYLIHFMAAGRLKAIVTMKDIITQEGVPNVSGHPLVNSHTHNISTKSGG